MKVLGLTLLAALAACTKTNSKYCNAPGDCVGGTCDLQQHRCMAGDGGGGDAQQPDARLGCRGPSECTTARPVCLGADAGMGGMCVECAVSDDCKDAAKPICGALNTCLPCTADAQCKGRADNGGVGLCEQGRCLTPGEVAFVDGMPAAVDCGSRNGSTTAP